MEIQLSEIGIISNGLMLPEGPITMPDGSVVFLETGPDMLTRLFPDGK